MSIASAACAATVAAVATASSLIGLAGSSDRIVIRASVSFGVMIGRMIAVEPLSRNGTSSACAPPSRRAEAGSRVRGAVDLGVDGLRPVEQRPHGIAQAPVGDVDRPRQHHVTPLVGTLITAASTPSTSTIVRVIAFNVVSRERLLVKELEIS